MQTHISNVGQHAIIMRIEKGQLKYKQLMYVKTKLSQISVNTLTHNCMYTEKKHTLA